MIKHALKEWSIACDLMLQGEFAILLRKGGIIEDAGPGMFRPKYPRFLLFPSWAHQKPQMLIPPWCDQLEIMDEPEEVPIKGMADLIKMWEVPSRQSFDQLTLPHIWTETQIDMRFDYKPNNPTFLMLLRVQKFEQSIVIPNRTEYGGCKSWVDLNTEDQIQDPPTQQVIPESKLEEWGHTITAAMGEPFINHLGPGIRS